MSTMMQLRWIVYVSLGWSAVSWAQTGSVLQLPFEERFTQESLDSAWKVDVSAGNAIAVKDGSLQISARTNTFAHVERPLNIDFLRAGCAIKGGTGVSWCTSLFIYWDAGNWCQMGIIERDGGRYYVVEMINRQPHEYELGRAALDQWQPVAIEMAADCIRYFSGKGAQADHLERITPRPEEFNSTPIKLILGKGHGGPAQYPKHDLNNDYADKGSEGVSWVREVTVSELPREKLRMTAEERRTLQAGFVDTVGEQELAKDQDPDFESVARHFPPMQHPREVTGVKDHPYDIGIAEDATLQLNDSATDRGATIAYFQIGEDKYRFGSGKTPCRKRLLNGWMPIVVATDEHDGLPLEQTIFGWTQDMSADAPLFGYVRLKVANPTAAAREVALKLVVASATIKAQPLDWQIKIPASGETTIEAKVPYPQGEMIMAKVSAQEFDKELNTTTAYWEKLIAQGSRFDLPEQRVQDAYRAWLAYNFLNVDKRDGVYHVCDGAGFYEQVYGYSDALYCRVLDMMGYPEQARMYMDSLLTFVQPDGLLCVNYGSADIGTTLRVLSHHYRLHGDEQWIRKHVPTMLRMCDWVTRHRKESMFHMHGKRAVVHGLVRYRPYCDLELPVFDYNNNGILCMGMKDAAALFGQLGMKAEAERIAKESDAYYLDVHNSMEAAIITKGGMSMLPVIPDTQYLLKETNYTANGYYGLIASCMLETGILPYDHPRTDLVVNMMRERGGLVAGVCQFFDMADHAYAYGYWMTCLQRDEVKRVILGLYGSMAFGMTRETYSAVECTRIRSGDNYWTLPHTYSNTQQLQLLRNMLVLESDKDLHIGYAIPRPWLVDGRNVVIKELPTYFGEMSVNIQSQVTSGKILVQLDPPKRGVPGAIKIRLRHPAKLPIKGVEAEPNIESAIQGDIIELRGLTQAVKLKVNY